MVNLPTLDSVPSFFCSRGYIRSTVARIPRSASPRIGESTPPRLPICSPKLFIHSAMLHAPFPLLAFSLKLCSQSVQSSDNVGDIRSSGSWWMIVFARLTDVSRHMAWEPSRP